MYIEQLYGLSWAMHVFSVKVICPRGRKLTISLHLTLSCGITFVLTDKQLFYIKHSRIILHNIHPNLTDQAQAETMFTRDK